MQNGDFELGGYLMGKGQPVFATAFKPGGAGERLQDLDHPFADTRVFGRDQKTPPIWQFEFSVAEAAGKNPTTVVDSLEDLATAWESAVDRQTPGEYTALRYMVNGRVRRVYGRPRNFDWDPSRNIEAGNVVASAQFALRDTTHYDDSQITTEMMLRQPPTGYVTLPAVWPLQTVVESTRQGSFVLAGRKTVQPEEITFYGPVTNPVLAAPDWTIALNGTIPYDGSVTVRPWDNTVTTDKGQPVPGWLSRKTYLPDVQLAPGPVGLTFTGTDPTGTARVVLTARAGYNSL